jgi:hypothetical protein
MISSVVLAQATTPSGGRSAKARKRSGPARRLDIAHGRTGLFVIALTLLVLIQAATAHATGPRFVQVSVSGNEARVLVERGKRSEHGVGAAQDIDRAIQLYCEAARLGDAEAHYHLGWIYLSGTAGKVDELLAATWFTAASAKDNPWARTQLEKLGATDLELLPNAECVQKSAMVARVIPRQRRGTNEAKPTGPASAPSPTIVVRSLEHKDIRALVQRLAPDFNLDPELVLAVIEVESNFNPRARSPKNAQGLMQLIPATASRFGVRDVWDPVDNMRGGMAYLRWLLDHFDGNLELALAGYNAGEGAVKKHGGIPPFPETQAYVKRITKKLNS